MQYACANAFVLARVALLLAGGVIMLCRYNALRVAPLAKGGMYESTSTRVFVPGGLGTDIVLRRAVLAAAVSV